MSNKFLHTELAARYTPYADEAATSMAKWRCRKSTLNTTQNYTKNVQ
jgi:hypothetical protein